MFTSFGGKYNHTIDAKNRLIFPNRLRELIGEEGAVTITKGFDHCLYAYNQENWKVFEEKIANLPLENPDTRLIQRQFLGYSVTDTFDKQGRILITPDLKKHAFLERDVVLIGSGKRIEIWDRERFESASGDETDMDELAAKLAERGISL